MPPPPSTQTVSEAQGPPALLVVKSVPPTQMTYGDSIGHHVFVLFHAPLSPAASKKLWPWEAIFLKYGSSLEGSGGSQYHDELKFKGNGLSEDMPPNSAVSLEPTYTYSVVTPGAMPSA